MENNRGEGLWTFHARDQLKKRYKLELPPKLFLDHIEAGKCTQLRCVMTGRAIFDVHLEEPPISVRTVIGTSSDGAKQFIISFLPQEWPEAMRKKKKAKGAYHGGHFKSFNLIRKNDAEQVLSEEEEEELWNISEGQTEQPQASSEQPTSSVNPAPTRFSTLALQLSALGLKNVEKRPLETPTTSFSQYVKENDMQAESNTTPEVKLQNLRAMLRVTPRGNPRDEEMRTRVQNEINELESGGGRSNEAWRNEAKSRLAAVEL
jgi:hypothetical protein